jgi:antitoxin component YwqK of YwqJK toxin-antitoxin module
MSLEKYTVSGDQLILHDAELGLNLVLPFTLPRLPKDFSSSKVLSPGVLLVLERDQEKKLRAAYLTQDGKRNGQCRLYYPSGNVQAEMFYLMDSLHGPSMFFSEEGKLLSRVFFCEGKRTGKGYLYFLSGKTASVQRFTEGISEGIQEYFYENGTVKSSIPYQSGQLHGEVRLFWENGQLKRKTQYVEGKRNGKDLIWNEQGILVDEGEYHAGQPCGLHRHCFENGDVKEEIVYHVPIRFDRKEWNAQGNLIYEGTWADDLTYTEKVGQELRKGYWDGSRLCWK